MSSVLLDNAQCLFIALLYKGNAKKYSQCTASCSSELGTVPTSGTAGYCTRTFALQDILNYLFLCFDLCKCIVSSALLDTVLYNAMCTAG
jgi:hypothetical protein